VIAPRTRGVLLSVAMLSLAALAIAVPAQARITNPIGTPVTGSSSNTQFTAGGTTITCNTSTFTGTVTGTENVSGNLTFSESGRTTCRTVGLGLSADVRCVAPDTITLRLTGSPRDTRSPVSGEVSLDANFTCQITVLGVTLTVSGPQAGLRSGTYDNRGGLTVNVSGIRTEGDIRDSNARFTGNYRVTAISVAP
jgi:hypothetical protein